MALVIGPIACTDDEPTAAVVQAFQAIRQILEPHHIQVSPAHTPPAHDGPVWRWMLVDGALSVLDPEITVFEGHVERGHWRPMEPATPAEIRRGIAIRTDLGWVVAAVADDDHEAATELVEQALAHVAALYGAE